MKRREFIFSTLAAALSAIAAKPSIAHLIARPVDSELASKKWLQLLPNPEYETAEFELRWIGVDGAKRFIEYPLRLSRTEDGQYRLVEPFIEV